MTLKNNKKLWGSKLTQGLKKKRSKLSQGFPMKKVGSKLIQGFKKAAEMLENEHFAAFYNSQTTINHYFLYFPRLCPFIFNGTS